MCANSWCPFCSTSTPFTAVIYCLACWEEEKKQELQELDRNTKSGYIFERKVGQFYLKRGALKAEFSPLLKFFKRCNSQAIFNSLHSSSSSNIPVIIYTIQNTRVVTSRVIFGSSRVIWSKFLVELSHCTNLNGSSHWKPVESFTYFKVESRVITCYKSDNYEEYSIS